MGKGKPRKLRLSPVQGQVLWVLEEAGEENLPTIINTLRAKYPDLSNEELHRKVSDAVAGLSNSGLVYVSSVAEVREMVSVVLTTAGRDALNH